ncbi:hypothetical protein SEA_MADAMATO_13 [Streptomyces phage Madamato]|nr:hypothetical protein SEA_MADAMATO_13 [Streptomyces phage Madamato]
MADELVHEYDAAKRRAYYLKTRQLKGRKTGVTYKPVAKTRAQRQAERRKKLEAEVTALKGRLEKLRKALAVLTEQAKARSGADSKSTTSTAAKSADNKQTAAQKAKDAKASKEYYEKNKDKLLEDQVKSLKAKIKTIQERIEKMRKNGSVGARNSTDKK